MYFRWSDRWIINPYSRAFGAVLIGNAPMNLDAAQLNETHPSRNIAKYHEAYREKKDAETQPQVLLIEQRHARS